jgi:threonine synthase
MAKTQFQCIHCQATYPLEQAIYACSSCGALLDVVHDPDLSKTRRSSEWKSLFASRSAGMPGPEGSGVWRYHEWVLPDIPHEHIVTLGEGNTPLVDAKRLGEFLGVQLWIKQCGQSHTGSFKDLGMTVLVSQVAHMQRIGHNIKAVICASTGDTSAALAAYSAAAGLRCVVLLPKGKISAAQLVQPLAHGARVLSIDTDFDGCMEHVQKLAKEPGVYLANSKNSLRIEGQKTVAFEIAQGLGWQMPDWVAIPGGNLGNVSAIVKGFDMLYEAGLIDTLPRVICAQAAQADPLYRSYTDNFSALKPLVAGPTQASAIRIGNPVSFTKAVKALQKTHGVVESISEQELCDISRIADERGMYLCPHTSVATAAVRKLRHAGTIQKGENVVVVSTAHGLKFTEFKTAVMENRVSHADLKTQVLPREVSNNPADVLRNALD